MGTIYLCDVRELKNKSRNVLKTKNISTMDGLLYFVENNSLMSITGVGEGTVENITKVCSMYKQGLLNQYIYPKSAKPFANMRPLYNDVPVSHFIAFGMSKQFVNRMSDKYKTFGELRDLEYPIFVEYCKESEKSEISKIGEKLEEKPAEVLKYVLNNLKNEDNYEVILKRVQGYSLEESGQKSTGITRERVRQIMEIVCDNIGIFVKLYFNSLLTENKRYIDLQEIFEEFDLENTYVIEYVGKKLSDYEYVESAEKYVKIYEGEKFTENLTEKLTDIFKDGAYIYEKEEEIYEVLKQCNATFLEREDIINLLKMRKFNIYRDFISKEKSYGKLAATIIGEYFPEGVSICSNNDVQPKEDFLKLRNLVERKFQIKVDASDRAFSARIADCTIQCGRGKVISKERVKCDIYLMTKIHDYIYQNSNQEIYFAALFNKFKDELQEKTNINNEDFLHGVIRYYFPNDFSYTRNTVKANKFGNIVLLSDRIIECIRKENRPMTKKELQKIFPEMTSIMFSNRLYQSKDIVTWGFDRYYLKELIDISLDEIDRISDSIVEIQNSNEGYCSAGMLYEKLSEIMPQVLQKNNITNKFEVYSLVATFLSEKFDCSSPHILKKGCFAKISIAGIITQLFDNCNVITYDEINERVSRFKWSEATRWNLISEMDEEYLLIADGQYLRKTKLDLQDRIDKIEMEICKYEKGGIVAISDSINLAELPEIGNEWNGYLLKSVVENFGKRYKVVQVQNKNRRFIQFFIVRKDSELNFFDQVVADLMKKEGLLTISEGKMLSWLKEKGLQLKTVPVELKNSEWVKYDSKAETFSVSF